jgi:hypothetical protein
VRATLSTQSCSNCDRETRHRAQDCAHRMAASLFGRRWRRQGKSSARERKRGRFLPLRPSRGREAHAASYTGLRKRQERALDVIVAKREGEHRRAGRGVGDRARLGRRRRGATCVRTPCSCSVWTCRAILRSPPPRHRCGGARPANARAARSSQDEVSRSRRAAKPGRDGAALTPAAAPRLRRPRPSFWRPLTTPLHHHRLTEVLPMFPLTSVYHHPGCSSARP